MKTGGYEAEFGQATGGAVQRRHEERFERAQRQRFGTRDPTISSPGTTPCRAWKAL